MDTPEVKEKYQLDNYVLSIMIDKSIVISTVGGQVLGMYQTEEQQTLSLAMLLSDLDNEVNKILLRYFCLNLMLAHNYVILDSLYISKAADNYQKLFKRVKKKIDAVKVTSPLKVETEEEVLDEVELQAKISEMS